MLLIRLTGSRQIGNNKPADSVEKLELACIFSFLSMNNNSIPMQKIRKKKEGHYIEEGQVNVEAWHLSGNDTQTSTMPCP